MWSIRRRRREPAGNHTDPLPDGDTVVPDGYRRWSDLLTPDGMPLPAGDAFTGPTVQLPVCAPFMTPAAQWRSRWRRSWT